MGKQKNKYRWLRGAGALCAAALCFAVFTGCGERQVQTPEPVSIPGYSEAQYRVIASSEKKRFEDALTKEVWTADGISGSGEGLLAELEKDVRDFMEELKVVSYIAGDQGVVLTDTEEKAMAGAAEEYYNSLSQSDIEAMGITHEEVAELFREYCAAQKFAGGLAHQDDLEVSDSEAKVIHVLLAATENRDSAVRLREMAEAEGADFGSLAKELGIAVREMSPGRGQAFDEDSRKLEEAEFSLASGQVSEVLDIGGVSYVVLCVSDYDEEATRERKDRISDARVESAFRRIYEAYADRVKVASDAGTGADSGLLGADYAGKADFFSVYNKYKLQ